MGKKNHRLIKDYSDSGFGSRAGDQAGRLINRDGTFNVQRKGIPFFQRFSFFHSLITMPWWRFHLVILSVYLLINVFFAALFSLIGAEHFDGIRAQTPAGQFLELFFFSAQTFTTVGYGRVNPVGIAASLLSAVESLIGLMGFALATGSLYGRFARPIAKIIFSDIAIIAPYRGTSALMLRLANARDNQLIDIAVRVMMSKTITEDTGKIRKFYNLELERSTVNFFPLSWTVVHPITEDSPFFGYSAEDLVSNDIEIMVSLSGYDDTYAQTVHARTSYKSSELRWGAKFRQMFKPSEEGNSTEIDVRLLSDVETADLT